MPDFAFASIPVPERAPKPRTRGLNMMIDWGMGLARQADTLESAGLYIDNAKIAASIPRVSSVVPRAKADTAFVSGAVGTPAQAAIAASDSVATHDLTQDWVPGPAIGRAPSSRHAVARERTECAHPT